MIQQRHFDMYIKRCRSRRWPGGPCLVFPYRCSLGGSVHLDTEVVAVPLPVQLAVHHVEQVTHTDLLTRGHLRQGHPGWDVLVLGHPVGDDVISWRP